METKEKNFISAVIYVHNAETRIGTFLKTVLHVLEENFEKAEIICVNDHSEDRSAEVIRDVSKEACHTSISVLNMSYFHGLETAMNAGVDLSIGDFVLEFDGTVLDFAPEEIMKIYRKSLEGYDIVSASPQGRQRLTSRLFYLLFQRCSGSFYQQMDTESFRVLSRRVINRVSSMNQSVPYRKAVYASCGLKTWNLRYRVQDVQKAADRKEKWYRGRLAVDSLILFTEAGYGFSMLMTGMMMLTALFMLGYSLVIYLTQKPVEGWTTTILFLSFAFFGLFAVLTIIVKYLQILVNLVFKRKRYSFESIEKLTK